MHSEMVVAFTKYPKQSTHTKCGFRSVRFTATVPVPVPWLTVLSFDPENKKKYILINIIFILFKYSLFYIKYLFIYYYGIMDLTLKCIVDLIVEFKG